MAAWECWHYALFSLLVQQPPLGQGLLIREVYGSLIAHTTLGRTALDEWSVRRRDLYLTTPNTHNRHTSMPPVKFEPTISAHDRPRTYALDRAATGSAALGTAKAKWRMKLSSVAHIPFVFSYKDAIVLVATVPQNFSEITPKWLD